MKFSSLFLFLFSFGLNAIQESDCYRYWDCLKKNELKDCKPDCRQKDQKCMHDVNVCHRCYRKVEGDASPYYCDIMSDSRKHSGHPQGPQ